ncbi:MAG: site-specific integrase [Rhodospirillaceae bacterium]
MKQAKVLSKEELKRVLAVIAHGRHAARNRMALMLSYYAGLRVGEIASLTWSQVVDEAGRVKEEIRLDKTQTKGGQFRTIFVNAKLKREIREYQSTFEATPMLDGPLIKTQKRSFFSANTLCQMFGELYALAGIDGATSHSGRRWFITKLAHAGVSAKVIMTLVGHKHLSTTQRYIDVNDDMMRTAVEAL